MTAALSALDENGMPVDWWFIYKAPKLEQNIHDTSTTGYEYIYYDPLIGEVIQAPALLTDGKGALDLTLNSIFENPPDTLGWILYNDEMPPEAKQQNKNSFGHTKGVIAFDTDSKTAFWLLHSWPQYADQNSPRMPTPLYGQTFLCLSLDYESAGNIAVQMANHQVPQVYLPRLPDTLSQTDPLYLLAQTLNPNVAGDSDVMSHKTRAGMDFKVIAKNSKWNKDFWNDLVGPALQTDMFVETWIRGAIPPVMDSDGIHKIFDVKYIDFSPLGIPWAWPETKDHAKWGISVDSDWICVGDINRMVSQEKRGGGTIAFQDNTLWNALRKTDLIVPPPGQTTEQTKALIQSTHTATELPNHGEIKASK